VTAGTRARPVRAAVLDKPGTPLRIETLLLDPPSDGEVLVRMEASGVCHSDLHVTEGEWGDTEAIVLGHEGCGVVEEVGPGADPALRGRRVVLNWFAPCLSCPACQRGRQWECSGSKALLNRLPDGTTRLHRDGGGDVLPCLGIATFGEWSVVPTVAAVPVPDEIDSTVASLIGCCVSTGVGAAVKTAEVRPGATVAVYGLGGVGLSVVMGAALAGAATIVAVDRSSEKLERATAVGATAGVVASDDDEETHAAVLDATEGGAEFAFEAIGLQRTIDLTIRSARTGGTAVIVGMAPFGVRGSFDAYDLVDRSLRVLGANYGFTVGALDFPRYASLHLAGKLPIDQLVERRIGLEDVEEAFDAMRHGEGARRVIVHGTA
jgi:S-(hydroxymethyl)glutathione dehydrogenase / alcohol dehydrogenase